MSALREKLLLTIYRHFENWIAASDLDFACQKGCATCCTQNVNVTAVEADIIHQFIREKGREAWFAEKLELEKTKIPALETTNEFAAKCLAGEEGSGQASVPGAEVCPFLEETCCQIYEVRPFACRSFASVKTCEINEPAQLPQYYITATSAAQQLIEHIGQGEYWGNMHDVLLALCDLKENESCAELLIMPSVADQARARLRKARPLPGFLIGADDYDKVSPFIEAVFAETIGEKTVEDILNGR